MIPLFADYQPILSNIRRNANRKNQPPNGLILLDSSNLYRKKQN
jgi:hypothetical protein